MALEVGAAVVSELQPDPSAAQSNTCVPEFQLQGAVVPPASPPLREDVSPTEYPCPERGTPRWSVRAAVMMSAR